MKFGDFVSGDAIRARLAAEDKEGAIREMIGALLEAGNISSNEMDSIVKAILKREEHRNVHGLTTAASIWLAAAIGFACGSGQIGVAVLGTFFTYITLVVMRRAERQFPTLPDDQA